jgi:hypothetical protein
VRIAVAAVVAAASAEIAAVAAATAAIAMAVVVVAVAVAATTVVVAVANPVGNQQNAPFSVRRDSGEGLRLSPHPDLSGGRRA